MSRSRKGNQAKSSILKLNDSMVIGQGLAPDLAGIISMRSKKGMISGSEDISR